MRWGYVVGVGGSGTQRMGIERHASVMVRCTDRPWNFVSFCAIWTEQARGEGKPKHHPGPRRWGGDVVCVL